jgi:putative GTP pyrophosphokinase
VRKLEAEYRNSNFKHVLVSSKDYIAEPKPDGYRGIHLIYRYSNPRAPAYDGLSLELQVRTRVQHAWATAVETMGTFLGQALKSGQGEQEWRSFFAKASAALAIIEKSPAVPGFEN